MRLHAPAAGLHFKPRGPCRGLAHRPRVWLAAAALAVLAGVDCARRLPPPVLFPARTVWLAPGDDVLEPPLALDEARVFAAGRGGTLRALDRGSGAVVWSQGGRPGLVTAGPGLLLLRQQDGHVLALDPASGETRWQANSGVAGTLPAALAEGLVVVAGAGAAALDAATGRTLWSAQLPPLAAPPVVAGGQVLLGGEDGTLHALDARSGAALWTYATSAPLAAAPVVDERRRVLLGTGARRVVALRADERGSERWRFKVGGALGSPPALFEDAVLFAAYDAVLYAFRRGNGHQAWRSPLPSRPLSGPLLARGAVLVACHESEIVGYDARSGQRLGNLTTPAPMQTPPLLSDDTLYVGLRDRSLVALRLAEATLEAPAASPSPSPGRRERRRPPGPRSPDSPPPPTPEPSSDP